MTDSHQHQNSLQFAALNAPAAAPSIPLLARVPKRFGSKLLLLVLLAPLLNLCYFLPQWLPLFRTAHRIPVTPIDRLMPFNPWWVYAYLSMYVMILIPPVLAVSGDQLRRYAIGMAVMFVAAAVCFFLYPVAYDRPPYPTGAGPLYRLVVRMDQPINCIPSLHAGMTVYAMLYAARILAADPPPVRNIMLVLGWIWAALILYATLATKQHYFLDLPAGAMLAWVSHWVAWRKTVPN